jgi:hypothetical protein
MRPSLPVFALLLPLLAGCAATIVPPRDLEQPRAVEVLTHDRHTTLLLTAADASRLRYAYADWAWYVEGEQGLRSGARALLSPSQAAFGRQRIAAQQPGERLQAVVGVGIDERYRLAADAERVDALIERLDRQFHASPAEPRLSPSLNLVLVPHPRPYTFAYNSNHMVADWLRELGFEVRGNPAVGRWKVATGTPATAPTTE